MHILNSYSKIRQSLWIVFIVCAVLNVKAKESLALYDLTCEYQVNPLGIDQAHPQLSWKIKSNENDVFQTAYEIRVTTDPKSFSRNGLSWTSGKVSSDQSAHIPYQGNELKSGQRYYWQVRIWDNNGRTSSWSTINFWEMGLLSPNNWKAKWIQFTKDTPKPSGPSPMFRKAWNTKGKVKQARLYITSYGLYEAYINGERVGDAYFTPGWTSYHKQLQYQVYDVSSLVKTGNNAIGVLLGDGWFRGNLMGGRNFWGKDLSLLAQLVIEYTNGEQQLITSDSSWQTSLKGPILLSDIYDGERYKRQEGNSRLVYCGV